MDNLLPITPDHTAKLSHQLEFEVGYSKVTDSGAKLEIAPLTLNYRAEVKGTDKLGYYFGAGTGITRATISGFGLSDDDNAFTLQGFGGVSYKLSDSATFNVGLKYIWIGKATFFGYSDDIGHETAVTAGLSFKF